MSENTSTNNIDENSSGPSHSNLNGGIDLSNHKMPSVSEEKSSESVRENSMPNTPSTPKKAPNSAGKAKKRKKCPRDAKAPKQPLTGYFRFLNDRREKVRSENPTMPFSEITRQLAAEWNVLPADQKQQYLDAAEQDKERYIKEFNDYKQTDAYKLFLEKQSAEKNESKKEKNGPDTASTSTVEPKESRKEKSNDSNDTGVYDIPIFTEEFLEHNKSCEAELRQLRKATSDYESQNAVLQRHVDGLHAAVNRMEEETNYQVTNNQALQQHLDTLRFQLASCFASIPISGSYEGATLENIDSYVERLDSSSNGNLENSLRTALRSAVSRLDFIK